MKRAAAVLSFGLAPIALCASLWLAAGRPAWAARQETPPQEIQKPKYDYMGGFLSRSTQPLGLNEDPALRKILNEGPVKWALRAGTRQILD